MRAQALALTTTLAAAIAAAYPAAASAALKTAAGGGPNGNNGFATFTDFLNNIGTYLVYVGAAGGVIGLVAAGGMQMTGSPRANEVLGKAVFGLGIVLCAKAIFA